METKKPQKPRDAKRLYLSLSDKMDFIGIGFTLLKQI